MVLLKPQNMAIMILPYVDKTRLNGGNTMQQEIRLQDRTANPAPLGLLGFGMTTVLLNIHNAGFFPINSMILAMGLFYGGLGQVIAGIMEWKKNNTFGTTAFTSYGLFWLSFVGLSVMPQVGWADVSSNIAMACYLFMWGLFTFALFLGTLRISKALQVVFASLTVLFFLLALANFTGNSDILVLAGYAGIFCGFSAIYTGLAQVLNELYGEEKFPLGVVKS